jgi:hypothetical protein
MNWRVTTDVSECGPAKNETCKCCDFTPMGGKYCTNTSVPPVKCKHPNWHYDYPNTALFPNCQWWRRVLVFPLFLPSSIPSPPVLGVDVVVCLPCRYCLVRVCQAAQAEDLCVFVPSPVRFSFSFCVWLSDLRIVLEQPLPNLVLTPWGHVQTLYIHTYTRAPSVPDPCCCVRRFQRSSLPSRRPRSGRRSDLTRGDCLPLARADELAGERDTGGSTTTGPSVVVNVWQSIE